MPKYEVIIYWSEEDETRCLSIRTEPQACFQTCHAACQ
jgi:hypothetical protein